MFLEDLQNAPECQSSNIFNQVSPWHHTEHLHVEPAEPAAGRHTSLVQKEHMLLTHLGNFSNFSDLRGCWLLKKNAPMLCCRDRDSPPSRKSAGLHHFSKDGGSELSQLCLLWMWQMNKLCFYIHFVLHPGNRQDTGHRSKFNFECVHRLLESNFTTTSWKVRTE